MVIIASPSWPRPHLGHNHGHHLILAISMATIPSWPWHTMTRTMVTTLSYTGHSYDMALATIPPWSRPWPLPHPSHNHPVHGHHLIPAISMATIACWAHPWPPSHPGHDHDQNHGHHPILSWSQPRHGLGHHSTLVMAMATT